MLPTPLNNQANQTNTLDNSANKNRQNRGTGFSNLGSILNANQGAGEKIGQAVGNSIAGQAESVQAGIQKSQSQFETDKNKSTTAANGAVTAGATLARDAGEDEKHYTDRLNDTTTDYSGIGKSLAKAAYNGPNSLGNEEQIRAQATNVGALGQLAGTSEGQSQLLRSQVAQRGQYSQGQNALDSLLLGTSGQQYLQPARAQADQVASQANNAILNSTAQANATKAAINTSRVAALRNLNNSYSGDGLEASGNTRGLQTEAAKRATDYSTNATRLQQLLAGNVKGQNIQNKDVTDADRELLKHMSDYGVNNGNVYIDPNNTAAGYGALSQLSSNLTTNDLGKYKYNDNQRSAASNLAALLGDTQSQDEVKKASFNTDIQNDTQATDSQAALDAQMNDINGSIADNTSKANELQRLLKTYGVADMNLRYLDGGSRGDLFNSLKRTTGQSIDALDAAAGDKKLSSILAPIFEKYKGAQNSQTAQLNGNTMSVQDAALKRILGQ